MSDVPYVGTGAHASRDLAGEGPESGDKVRVSDEGPFDVRGEDEHAAHLMQRLLNSSSWHNLRRGDRGLLNEFLA